MTGTRARARPRWRGTVLVLAVALTAAGCGAPTVGSGARPAAAPAGTPAPRHCTVTSLLVPTCGAWWGMYLNTDPGGNGLTATVASRERALGRPLDIVEVYHDFSRGPNGIFPNPAEDRVARHHLLLFSWAPAIWSSHTVYRWAAISSGALDRPVIVPEAKRLRAFRHKVFLTFSAEPEGAVPVEGTPGQFVAAWRHIHDVFARLGVRNVVWVWTTTGYVRYAWEAKIIAGLYPGNAYVDWIGYDPYNFFDCHHNVWHSFAETVEPYYLWLTMHHIGTGKPLMLPEFGSAADTADPAREAAWYGSVVPVLRGLPRLKALVMWNSANRRCNLELSAAPAAARAAYRQTGLSPYLRQALP
jgi:hypothetical protein